MSQSGGSIFERTKAQTGLLEKIELVIPGFRGYKEKELRRESDRLLRNLIYQKLSDAEAQVKDAYRALVNEGASEAWDDTDHLIARMDRINERINHSEYGYAGFFDAIKVREPDLDRMMDYDDKLLEMSETIAKAAFDLKDSVDNSRLQEARGKVTDAMKAVNALETAYNGRKQVILGLQ
ncbi:hypothetical protein AUG19_06590 [archaeon 13_1_20CM_2_54_9]|nr:MAG: hypothetical protein AUJ07_09605 [Crenarchaeota archaeon 13_1_40CM_3_53_5]OLE75070.1 MAG: hypothetical protein AUG19_06590 [archaeon 13_1_20CM_2_54_9]TMI27316.1 MAG: hypothetical protein E6H36_03115 [Candidatus Bathyarchaeota archaeon]TMI31832.1 MAG: hypothetical protein E6H29_03740 [Candidatus Bathyarchaeota archaeon]